MNRLVVGVFVLAFWGCVSETASAEQYSLSCFGPHFGSSTAPISIAIDTAKKQFDVGGEASTEVTIDGDKASAMKETQMYQLDLSNLEGVVLNDDGLSKFECKRK